MPSYAVAGIIAGVFLLGVIIFTVFNEETPHSGSGKVPPSFNPGPGYDRPSGQWGSEDNRSYSRRRRRSRQPQTCGETCVICTEPLEDINKRNLPCGHKFHDTCIVEWFNVSRTCPSCRRSV